MCDSTVCPRLPISALTRNVTTSGSGRLLHVADDGIVVGMGMREEVDQLIADIKADGERMEKRMKETAERNAAAIAAEKERWRLIDLQREAARATHVRETPPDDGYGGRFERFERTLNAIAQDVGQLKTDVGQLKTDVAELKTDIGQLKTDVGQLKTDVGVLKTDVGQLKTDVGVLKVDAKERLATKVDVEALSHNIAMVADGFSETQRRLSYVADLLKRNVIAP